MKRKVDVERKEQNRKTHSPINSQVFRKGDFSNLCRKTNIYKNDVFF